jgi:hypothetical protein
VAPIQQLEERGSGPQQRPGCGLDIELEEADEGELVASGGALAAADAGARQR